METIITSATKTVVISPFHPMVIIGERINPTGRKQFAAAIEAGNMKLIQEEALRQVKEGAQILDVNVGVSGIDEPRMLAQAVQAIMEVTDTPLCIDSANVKALEAGLSVYRGKALVNSVNGEERKLREILPLVKAHKAAVIGLTMDNTGIPSDPNARLSIARKIVEAASREGISANDVVIDPLAMAISSDDKAGINTLVALQMIRDALGVNLALGVSNISFGLPNRSAINATFLSMAVMQGLTCSIIDPTVWEIRKAILIANLMLGKDEFCMSFIEAHREKSQ